MNRRRMMKTAALSTAALAFSSGAQAQRELPNVEVRLHNGRQTVFIEGKPNALAGWCPRSSDKFSPLFYKHGMGVYYIDALQESFWNGDKIESTPFKKGGGSNLSVDEHAERIINNDPNAYIIVRFYHHPPASWLKLHPQELFITETRTSPVFWPEVPSYASDLYWDIASRYCTAVVHYCESRPWANRVIGYMNIHIAEGVHMPVLEGWLYDHNPAMVQYWKEFLKKKYGTVEKLRLAHNDTTLTFESVSIPKDKLLGRVPEVSELLYWQNAKDNQIFRDYLELTREFWHKRFRQIAESMHRGANRKVLFCHDVFKQVMLGWNHNGFFRYAWSNVSWRPVYPEPMGGSGSIGVTSLFDAPGFDGFMVPEDYQARGLGGVCQGEGIVDTSELRGKYYFSEMDTRTGNVDIGPARNPEEYAVLTWRNHAASLTRGYNAYWHHGFFIADWFDSEPMRKTIWRQVDVINESLNWPHGTMPGIAMILDDSSVLETNGSGHYLNEAVMWEQKMGLARCGVPFRVYLFEDLALDNFPDHRVYYFPNLFKVDDVRLELLKKKVFRDGKMVIWGPGSGISDGVTIGTESAAKLTGFKFEMLPVNSPRRILLSNFDHPVIKGLDASTIIGGPLAYGPVLLPTDGTELGTAWTKGGNIHIGLSLKEFGKGAQGHSKEREKLGEGDYAAVFTTAVPIPAGLWRNLAQYAGAHVYSKSGDVLMADTSVIGIHSVESGKKHIALPGKFTVHDLITGKKLSTRTDEITFDLKSPDTRVFLLEK